MSRAKSAFALVLALTVAFASVGFVQARHMAAGAQTMVICTGYGLVQITIDADGNPVERTLPCPDCVVVPLALVADAGAVLPLSLVSVLAEWPLRDTLRREGAVGQWHSPRAPPRSFV